MRPTTVFALLMGIVLVAGVALLLVPDRSDPTRRARGDDSMAVVVRSPETAPATPSAALVLGPAPIEALAEHELALATVTALGAPARITLELGDGVIEGRTFDEMGAVVPGADVSVALDPAHDPDTVVGMRRFPLDLVSDAEGRFEISGLPHVGMVITAEADGHHGNRVRRLPRDAQPARATLVLMRAAEVSGTVTDSEGHPLPGAQVKVGSFASIFGEAVTDTEGRYRIESLAAEPVDVIVSAEQYITQGRFIRLRGGSTNTFDFVLSLGGRIGGWVRDRGTGAPLQGMRVTLVHSGPFGPSGDLTATDHTGWFDFTSVGEGAHTLFVQMPKQDPRDFDTHRNQEMGPLATLGNVRAGDPPVEIAVEGFLRRTGSITGTLVPPDGATLVWSSVTAIGPAAAPLSSTMATDDEGGFLFEDRRPGRHVLWARTDQFVSVPVTVELAEGEALDVGAIPLMVGGTVRLSLASDTPLTGLDIEAWLTRRDDHTSTADNPVRHTLVREGDEYLSPPLLAGPYVLALDSAILRDPGEIVVQSGVETALTVHVEREVKLEIGIEWHDGWRTRTGTRIEVRDDRGAVVAGRYHSGRIDRAWLATVLVPAGHYTVVVFDERGERRRVAVELDGKDVTVGVTIDL